MVAAIDFAVRGLAGGSQLGSVAGEGQGNFIQVGAGDSISLNLSRASIIGYERQGSDLVIQQALPVRQWHDHRGPDFGQR